MAEFDSVNRAKTSTLVASIVDRIEFAQRGRGFNIQNHDPSLMIWARFDGQDPTVEGDDCIPIPPGTFWQFNSLRQGFEDVRLISAGTPKYTVYRLW